MKILILTQPLHNNYGGILQAYALQTVLKRMGHDVATDSKPHGNTSVIRRIVKVIKRIILKYVLKKDIDVSVLKPRRNISIIKYTVRVIQRIIFKYALRKDVDVSVFSLFLSPAKGWNIINRHTLRFVKENISTVDFFKGRKKPDIRTVKAYDAIIAGSDQVWRKQFSDVSAHLLDFTKGMNVNVTVNKTGGLARLSSLLRIFNLENRLVSSFDELTDEIISDRVEWNHINNIISGKRKESVCFLSDNLVIKNK